MLIVESVLKKKKKFRKCKIERKKKREMALIKYFTVLSGRLVGRCSVHRIHPIL